MTSKQPGYLPSIGRLLNFAGSAVTTLSDRLLRKHGLTTKQWVVLTALWREKRMSETDLCSYCQASPSALNRIVDRMVARKLVRRVADAHDGRRSIVELAPQGKSLSGLLGFYEEVNAAVVEGFTAQEVKQFVSLLERADSNVRAALDRDGSTEDTGSR